MRRRVLLLGGTKEARRLAAALNEHPELELISSLAGRLARPELSARPDARGRVRWSGRVAGMAAE